MRPKNYKGTCLEDQVVQKTTLRHGQPGQEEIFAGDITIISQQPPESGDGQIKPQQRGLQRQRSGLLYSMPKRDTKKGNIHGRLCHGEKIHYISLLV